MKYKTGILILGTYFITGCSALNSIIGYQNAFKWEMNSEIGSNVDSFIKKRELHIKSMGISKNDDLHSKLKLIENLHSFSDGKVHRCEFAVLFETVSRKIVGWDYVSDSKECISAYFYDGPF